MKKLVLFPHGFQKWGYVLVLPFLVLGIAFMFWDFTFSWLNYPGTDKGLFSAHIENFTDELASIGLIVSLLFIGFSKEKVEDEAIGYFRLEALHWAVYANYLVLVLAILFCYGDNFFRVMTINLFTVLIIFIARFRYILYRYNQSNL